MNYFIVSFQINMEMLAQTAYHSVTVTKMRY